MSNSPLATHTLLSPNCVSPRERAITGIAIHCMVAQWTAKRCCEHFHSTDAEASSNYCVGYDGGIALCVEEKNRAWTTSSRYCDSKAITIEVASEAKYPYAVTDEAYKALVKLCADICKRNGIKALKWSNNSYDRVNWLNGVNMQVHRDYEPTKSCPGEYLYNRMQDIANSVNEILNGGTDVSVPVYEEEMCEVQVRELSKGDDGNDVLLLRCYLNANGYSCGVVDGDFGSKTDAAVRKYQKAKGLISDGIVGSNTWNSILAK